MKYNDVKYYETTGFMLEGGIHVYEENELLFNLNDLFDLLQLEKPKRNRWKQQLNLNLNNSLHFKRNNIPTCEAFITMSDVSFILSLYGQEILNQIKRKLEVEDFISKIIYKYECDNNINDKGYNNDLSYEFALETLKLFSDNHDNELDNIVNILQRYNISERSSCNINNDSNKEKDEPEEYTLAWLMKQVEEELKENK